MTQQQFPLNVEIIKLIKENPNLIEELFKSKGYKFYKKGLYNVNNFGIRVSTEGRDFDDIIGTTFANEFEGKLAVHAFEGTTDPGSYYLKNPINIKGTAILAPGQYFGYEIDKHRSQYDALCQRSGKVKVYRDGDKDEIVELDLDSLDEGMFGINIHKSSATEQIQDKNMFSAGCQEFMNSGEYDVDWMPIQYSAMKAWGNNFTYTLFLLEDFTDLFANLLTERKSVGSEVVNEE
jgi:hypothetical protein